jgi:hypothetical protein
VSAGHNCKVVSPALHGHAQDIDLPALNRIDCRGRTVIYLALDPMPFSGCSRLACQADGEQNERATKEDQNV